MKKIILAIVIFLIALTTPFLLYPVEIGLYFQRKGLESNGLTLKELPTKTGKLAYFEGGQGKTLILVHGFMADSTNWANAVPALLKNHRLLIPDLPGHGLSENPAGGLKMRDIIESLKEFIAAKAGDGQAILIGNSLGGWVCALYYLENTATLKSLVLVNSAGLKWDLQKKYLLPQNVDDMRQKLVMMQGKHAPEPPDFVLRAVMKMQAPRFFKLYEETQNEKWYLDHKFAGFKGNVYLVWGSGDQFFPLEYGKNLNKTIPGSKLHVIKDAAHIPHYTEPEKFSKIISEIAGAK